MKNNKGEVRGLINFLSLKRGGGGLIREGGLEGTGLWFSACSLIKLPLLNYY